MSGKLRGCGPGGLATWAAVFVLSIGSVLAQQELVVNGTFEAGWLPDGNCDLAEPDADSLPLGWNCHETFSSGVPETSLITLFPGNGPSLPGASAFKVWRGDPCHLSGDWTSIEQTLDADVTGCQGLTLGIDVLLLPLSGVHSHNLGGSGHVAGPCDPSGFEYPLTVVVEYTDQSGSPRCWQYGWYQDPVTQAGRTDPGCVSGFDGQNANPNPAVSMQIPTGQWVQSFFDLRTALPGVETIREIRVGGAGWTFYGVLDNVSILCEDPCAASPAPFCDAPCPAPLFCQPAATGDVCHCALGPCAQSQFPECQGDCPPGEACLPGPFDACECVALPCEQSPYPACAGSCPTPLICVADDAGACLCIPSPCQQSWPACDGPCPPGQACGLGLLDDCVCENLPCPQSPYPDCGGPCPAPLYCVADDAGACLCVAPPCDQTYPTCDGSCPTGMVCALGSLTPCQCVFVPCEQSPYPQCSAPCPPGLTCTPDPAGACACRRLEHKADWPDYAPSGMPDFEQLHAFPITHDNPLTICGPTALLDSFWWFDSEMECDAHRTGGDAAESEPNGSCDQADPLGEAPPLSAALAGAGDADWYVFDVPRGGTRSCSAIVSTYALAGPADADTRLRLYAGCAASVPGSLLLENDDYHGKVQSEISSWSLAQPVVLPPGRYWVEVDAGAAAVGGGPYTLTVGLDCYPLIERWIDTAPDDHSEYNVEPSIASLAVCANTDDPPAGTWRGTRLQDVHPCVDSWLQAKGLRGRYTDKTVIAPGFDEVAEEVWRSEDVLLLLGFYWPVGPQWVRCGGHYVTASGVEPEVPAIWLSDPFFDNAEPAPAGNAGPGRVRGPSHADHAPGVNPPPDHDDARNVSHDRYVAGPGLPGVAQWTLPAYATAGGPTTCNDVAPWCAGPYYGQNPKDAQLQDPCPAPDVPVLVAVEAMVDVSPVQSAVCLLLDPDVAWPDNLRLDDGPCGPAQPELVPHDVIRGKLCNPRFSPLAAEIDLGHVQCLYDDDGGDRFDDLSPDDDGCFGLWFYLVRQSGAADYGMGSNGDPRRPSSGGCP